MSTAEDIGRTLRRMRMGLVAIRHDAKTVNAPQIIELARQQKERLKVTNFGEIVDITAIWHDWKANQTDIAVYDMDMRPPYDEVTYGIVNLRRPQGTEAVTVLCAASTYERGTWEFDAFDKWQVEDGHTFMDSEGVVHANDDHTIEWANVRWITAVAVYVDVLGQPNVFGPEMSWRFAINEDGTTADVSWPPGFMPSTAMNEVLGLFCLATNWLNCRNVELVVPQRDKPERKRLARQWNGDVKEIHVRPVGKTRQDDRKSFVQVGSVPLHTVRGHIARYGIDGRKPLFGKYSGKFWIPAHARGSKEHGERHTTKVIDT